MKVFQVENGFCYWQTPYQKLSEIPEGKYPAAVQFVEAPDHVMESWGYKDGEFIKPTPPEGWLYDDKSGTFYPEGQIPPSEQQTLEQRVAYLENLMNAMTGGATE